MPPSEAQTAKVFGYLFGRISDAGCSHISRIGPSLESLEICGGGVGDLGCNLLSGLENLTSLNLSQNERITNRGASAFAVLKNLKALNLSNTRVDAAGNLRLPKSLQSLALYGCRGIEDGTGMALLQTSLPSLKCLRLNQQSNEDGMMVGTVDDSELFDDLDTQNIEGASGDPSRGEGSRNPRQIIRHASDNASENSMMEAEGAVLDGEADDESFYSDND